MSNGSNKNTEEGGERLVILRCEITKSGDVYEAVCLELSVASYGKTPRECRKNLQGAIEAYFRTISNHKDEKFYTQPVRFYHIRRILFNLKMARVRRRPTTDRFTLNRRLPERAIPIGI